VLVDVLVAGIDLVQGVHGVDGYVGSEGGVGGKGLFSSPPSPPYSVDLYLNPLTIQAAKRRCSRRAAHSNTVEYLDINRLFVWNTYCPLGVIQFDNIPHTWSCCGCCCFRCCG